MAAELGLLIFQKYRYLYRQKNSAWYPCWFPGNPEKTTFRLLLTTIAQRTIFGRLNCYTPRFSRRRYRPPPIPSAGKTKCCKYMKISGVTTSSLQPLKQSRSRTAGRHRVHCRSGRSPYPVPPDLTILPPRCFSSTSQPSMAELSCIRTTAW